MPSRNTVQRQRVCHVMLESSICTDYASFKLLLVSIVRKGLDL